VSTRRQQRGEQEGVTPQMDELIRVCCASTAELSGFSLEGIPG